MRVALPIWKDRLSPVMDTATRLLVVEYDDEGEVSRTETPINWEHAPQLAHLLSDLEIGLLICGAVSQHLFSLIESRRIAVIPWVTGLAEDILRAYQANRLGNRRFLMPGCGGRGRQRGRRQNAGRGRRRGQGPRIPLNNTDPSQEIRE